MLSDEERQFIVGGVRDNLRADGRSCEDYRVVEVECGLVSNTNGSARLKIGGSEVLVGVKADTVPPLQWRPDEGIVEVFVDCTPHANRDFEGHGGEDYAMELANIAENAVLPGIDLKELSILKQHQCWTLNIDVVVLQCGGNVCDAVCMAILAALHDTRLPMVTVTGGDGEALELEVSDDPYDCKSLSLSDVPVLVTLNQIGDCYVADASEEEERCTDAKMMIAVDREGSICYSAKSGRCGVDPATVFDMLSRAKDIGSSLLQSLEKALKSQAGAQQLSSATNVVGFLG